MFNFTDSPKIDGTHWPLAAYFNEYEAAIQKLAMAGLLADFAASATIGVTKNLVDADNPIQVLTPDTADQDVVLPTVASTNHPFFISNPAAASYSLVVKTGTTALVTLAAGESALFISVGSAWHVVSGSGGGGDIADLISADADNQLTLGADSKLFVPEPEPSAELWESVPSTDYIVPVSGKRLSPNANPLLGVEAPTTTLHLWTSTTLPSGWGWAGSPFSTPSVIETVNNRALTWRGFSGTERAFLYRSWNSSLFDEIIGIKALLAARMFTNNFYVGIRLDDGSDNNYAEIGLRYANTGNPIRFISNHRTGGGSVTTTEQTAWATAHMPTNTWLSMELRSTPFSNWDYRFRFMTDMSFMTSGLATGLTWTPTRVGITSRHQSYVWDTAMIKATPWV